MPTILPCLYDYVFPNYILPNALITELGLVNYLHSLNCNRLNRQSFFEQNINSGVDHANLLTLVFGTSLGTFPNSTAGGTHLVSEHYNHIVHIKEDSLHIGKKTHGVYIYPIIMSPHINDFTGFTTDGSKLNGEYFWKHMSAEALKDAQNGKAVVFLDFAQENFIEKSAYERLHDCLSISGIPPHKVVLAFNSFNAQELYEKWFSPEERLLEVRNWPYVLTNTSYYYFRNPRAHVDPLKFISSKNKIRENYFLFKIRRPRSYRQAFLYQLNFDNLLDKADWSWLENTSFNDQNIDNILASYRLDANKDSVRELFQKFPHPLKDEPNGTFNTISSWTDLNPAPYENSYFYLCTETYAHGEYKSVTEKVFKPMVNFMPFLFMSFPGALSLLRSLGFKTFSPYIDESYDDEYDEVKRFKMIYSEIKKLCSMSKEELHNWYWNMQDILLHNHQLVLDFYKQDKQTVELVEYLSKRVS